MGNVLEVVGAISPGLKLGWMVFAAWTLAQAAWFVRTRVPAAARVKSRKRSRHSSARRTAAQTQSARGSGSDSDAPELLTSLGLLQTPGVSQYGVPMSSGSQSGPTVIA